MTTTTPSKGKRGAAAQKALTEAITSSTPVFPFPPSLPDELQEIWTETVNTKTGDYWSRGDIPLLEMYCRNTSDIRRLSAEIKEEGEIIFNANGNLVVNPKIVVRGYAETKLMSLCTKLRLQPSSRMDTKNEGSQLKKKTKATRAAQTIADDGDDLLASTQGTMQ